MERVHPNTPILVGGGQKTHAPKGDFSPSPIEMMAAAARLALTDCGMGSHTSEIDAVTVTRFIHDAPGLFTEDIKGHRYPFGVYAAPPKSVAALLAAAPKDFIYGPTGGNTPQLLINLMAERIAQGKNAFVVLAGTECLNSLVGALKNGAVLDWNDDQTKEGMEDLGQGEMDGASVSETKHGLNLPVNIYPMFENAICEKAGRSMDAHRKKLGALMAPFTSVAAANPHAWFPTKRSAEEIIEPTADNRFIAFPYTKYLNAVMRVDQSAAVVMMNVREAERLGVPKEKWVFLHGCADAQDTWFVSERINFYESPAVKKMGEVAFQMAGWSVAQLQHMDLYSCFPSAVQYGMQGLGIKDDDPRGLTVTGGLPYFGGAGNNYTMHAVATMMERLRSEPESKGMCTANGYYATKHSIGLYSTAPFKGEWRRTPLAEIQAALDGAGHPSAVAVAEGAAKLLTSTVCFGRESVDKGLMIGELETGERFCAWIEDEAFLQKTMKETCVGAKGKVTHVKGVNIWRAV